MHVTYMLNTSRLYDSFRVVTSQTWTPSSPPTGILRSTRMGDHPAGGFPTGSSAVDPSVPLQPNLRPVRQVRTDTLHTCRASGAPSAYSHEGRPASATRFGPIRLARTSINGPATGVTAPWLTKGVDSTKRHDSPRYSRRSAAGTSSASSAAASPGDIGGCWPSMPNRWWRPFDSLTGPQATTPPRFARRGASSGAQARKPRPSVRRSRHRTAFRPDPHQSRTASHEQPSTPRPRCSWRQRQ